MDTVSIEGNKGKVVNTGAGWSGNCGGSGIGIIEGGICFRFSARLFVVFNHYKCCTCISCCYCIIILESSAFAITSMNENLHGDGNIFPFD